MTPGEGTAELLLHDVPLDREAACVISRHISPPSLWHAAVITGLDAVVPLRDAQILAGHATPGPPSTMAARAADSTGTLGPSAPVSA